MNLIARFSKRIRNKIRFLVPRALRYIQLHLFITLFSWPLLMHWGLPLSYASMVGNLIFTPFLSSFLLLSSLIFFCELLYIPTTPLIILLELLTKIWTGLLSFGSRSWLVSFAQPSYLLAVALPVGACALVQYKKLLSPLKSTISLILFTILTGLFLKIPLKNETKITTVPCFSKELIVFTSSGKTALIDPGPLGRTIGAPSWVRYTLVPTLIKQGVPQIELIICTCPSSTTFRALTALVEAFAVKKIIMPAWKGKLFNTGWASWEALCISGKNCCTEIILINNTCTFTVGNERLILHQAQKVTTKNNLSFHSLGVQYEKAL